VSLPRLYCPGAACDARVALPPDAAHHARVVLRLRPGAPVRLFDGAGHEYAATLETLTPREARARVTAEVAPRPESPLPVTLALAALKGDRMEWALQKAVELGVADLRPLVTLRTDSAARPALQGARHERWTRVTVSAAEQCGRAVVPAVAPAVTLEALLAERFLGLRLLFCERAGQASPAALPRPERVLALVGPEGGWDDAEIEAARAAGCIAVGLGPRVLRAETAVVAALTALQVLWGDLG
jgi:16S rRNA (uracil1498-N3)-methyltransferase